MLEPDKIRGYRRKLASIIAIAGSDDPETFALVMGMLDDAIRRQMPEAAQRLRSEGFSYTDLAAALGVHRSAALQRFGPRGPDVH